MIPLPQIVVQLSGLEGSPPIQLESVSIIHVESHPSLSLVFESSQASLPIFNPSPHTGFHTSGVVLVPPEHEYPVSIVQVLDHPFPSVVSPSSHPSEVVFLLSPQTCTTTSLRHERGSDAQVPDSLNQP